MELFLDGCGGVRAPGVGVRAPDGDELGVVAGDRREFDPVCWRRAGLAPRGQLSRHAAVESSAV